MKRLSKKLSILLVLAIMLTGVFGMPFAAAEESLEADIDLNTQVMVDLEMPEAADGTLSYNNIESARRNDATKTKYSLDDGISNFIYMPSEAGEGQRVTVDASGVDIGSFTYTLSTSNSVDFILFTSSVPRTVYYRLSSSNGNYRVQPGFVDSAGSVWVYSQISSPGGIVGFPFPETNGSRIYNCFVVFSNGSLGDQYTLTWNKTSFAVDETLYLSPDFTIVVTLAGNYISLNGVSTIYLGNGGSAWGDGSSQLNWTAGWSLTTPTGYSRRTITVNDPHINRDNLTYANSIVTSYTCYGPSAASSDLAIWLELDYNTLYQNWRSVYNQNASPPLSTNTDDYLGFSTARRLYTEPIEWTIGDKHYLVVDIQSGTSIDLFGLHNLFYVYDGYQLPTYTILPKA